MAQTARRMLRHAVQGAIRPLFNAEPLLNDLLGDQLPGSDRALRMAELLTTLEQNALRVLQGPAPYPSREPGQIQNQAGDQE